MADRPLTRNAADPADVKDANAVEQRRAKRFAGALGRALQIPDVRLVVAALLEEAGLDSGGYDAAGSFLYYREGQRAQGLRILKACRLADEAATALMEAEQRERNAADARDLDAAARARAQAAEDDA